MAEQLEPHKARMMTHMNEDHGDSIIAYARHYGKLPRALDAKISDMSETGLTLEVVMPGGETESGVFVPYSRPLVAVKDVRPIVVEMHHEANAALGFMYKLRSGYFKTQAKNKLEPLLKSTQGKLTLMTVAGFAMAGIGALVLRARRNSTALTAAPTQSRL